jgi:hypothetical protein
MKKIRLAFGLFLLTSLIQVNAQTTILLNSNSNWYDTEYDCTSGNEIRIIAFGAHADNPDTDNWVYGPGGHIYINNGSIPYPGIQDNALIGKIGSNGEPFYVGVGGKFTPEQTGRLYIMVNDGDLTNNAGHLIVKIFNAPLKTYLLNTNDSWADTDLDLVNNHEYFIYATGSHADNPNTDNWVFSPSGKKINNGSVPIPGLQDNCLIGKVGAGEGFYVGVGGKYMPDDSGRLYFMVNDGDLSNNVGHLIIQIFDNESSTSSVAFINTDYSVSVFPNPANNNLAIDIEQQLNEFSIELFDLSGKQILKEISGTNFYNLQLNDILNGTYILKLKNKSNELIRVEKIIKQ